MDISRRGFLQFCIGSAAVLGLEVAVVGRLKELLAADGAGMPTVIWLNGANCTGCTVSLANLVGDTAPVDVAETQVPPFPGRRALRRRPYLTRLAVGRVPHP